VAVSLTAEGRRMYGLILPRMAQIHLDLVSVLSDEELAQFDTLLARLQRHALTLEAEGRYDALPRVDRGRHRR
jgi:DNA-binding MarR family transcriptional regulator